MFLLFKRNVAFKESIINGSILFFENVFPSLFPMFIINDVLMNYNAFNVLDFFLGKVFKKIFHTSKSANYIFILSLFSGTPTNGYIATNLVKEKKISSKEAGIVLMYAFFLNPLFLYNMLLTIFNSQKIAIKIIIINYAINFFFAFLLRKYNYSYQEAKNIQDSKNFMQVVAESINRSLKTLVTILGTILFYFILCEGINTFFNHPIVNCITNGLLEATGGLSKLVSLQVSFKMKEILATLFISFGGFSIHTQIKNIISDVQIPYKYLFFSRILHALLSTTICIICP